MIEIHRALTARGAGVYVLSQGGPHERELTAAGVAFDRTGPGIDERRCETFLRSIPGIGHPDQSMWSDDELRAYVAAEVTYFRERRVRVAVTGWTLTALLSARVAGIPLVTEHAGSFVPPMFERRMLPAPKGRIGMPLERWLPAPVRRVMYNAAVPGLSLYTGGFNRVARELGVEGVPSFPALLLGDLTLVTDVPEVLGIPREELDAWTPKDPSRYRRGTRLRYTGPLYAHLASPVPERVERFLEGPRPIVYVAITSSPARLVRDVVTALRPLGARLLVASTVHDLRDLECDQVMVEGVLPSHLIMPRVDLGVTAGGQGSVQTALASGLPFIGIPLQPEQDANVFLAQRQGAARLVPLDRAGGPALTKAARELLGDDRFRRNARRLQAIFERSDGAGAAAEAILELARGAGPPPPTRRPPVDRNSLDSRVRAE
jgi:UDP:flavonoid glycosyltransferase YjiC (YdhE family)